MADHRTAGPPVYPPDANPSAAYVQGVTARLNRERAEANPYESNSDEQRQDYLDWEHGYWWAAHNPIESDDWLSRRLK